MVELGRCANLEIAEQCSNADIVFRIRDRLNRLLGLWAASELGLTGMLADGFADERVTLGNGDPGDDALVYWIAQGKRAAVRPCKEDAIGAERHRLSRIAAIEYAPSEPYLERKAA